MKVTYVFTCPVMVACKPAAYKKKEQVRSYYLKVFSRVDISKVFLVIKNKMQSS